MSKVIVNNDDHKVKFELFKIAYMNAQKSTSAHNRKPTTIGFN